MDWLVVLALNLLFTLGLFLFLSRRLRKQYSAESFLQRLEEEVNAITTEMNRSAEQNVMVLEDKVLALKTVIGDAEKAVEELKRQASLGRISAQESAQRVRVAAMEPPRQEPQPLPKPVEPRKIEVPVQAASTAYRPQPRIPPAEMKDRVEKTRVREERLAEIVRLADAGIDVDIIAQTVGMSRGEVELVLSLQQSRG